MLNDRLWLGFRMAAQREQSSRHGPEGRFWLGFRMAAQREQSSRHGPEGRRPKASEERTRGTAASSWPSMGNWSGSGVGGGWFCADWRELRAADDYGPGAASVAEGLIGD